MIGLLLDRVTDVVNGGKMLGQLLGFKDGTGDGTDNGKGRWKW